MKAKPKEYADRRNVTGTISAGRLLMSAKRPNGQAAYKTPEKLMICGACVFLAMLLLIGRLGYVMIFQAQYYLSRAEELHERERVIKASRGRILDTNGIVLVDNKTVCTISVIHSQIQDAEAVIHMLTSELGLDEAQVRKRVEKYRLLSGFRPMFPKKPGIKSGNTIWRVSRSMKIISATIRMKRWHQEYLALQAVTIRAF